MPKTKNKIRKAVTRLGNQEYKPDQRILDKYADVLVNFALGGGKGIKKGDVVAVHINEAAKPLYASLLKTIWKAGGHVLPRYNPINEPYFKFDRAFFEYAQTHQLDHFPDKYLKGLVEQVDHTIFILSDTDKQSLNGIDPQKIMKRGIAQKQYVDWRTQKENEGKYTWTIAMYGTPAMAREAGLSLKEYWNQIIKACFLDSTNPIAEWKDVYKQVDKYRLKLNKMKIEKVHVEGSDMDLWVKIGADRQWLAGSGRNIPSFEIFTSPDWRGTEGWIRFSEPLYAYGNKIEGIELEFKNGKVVKSKAKKNYSVLKNMISSPNADKLGEFSLTDCRFSRITKFMAETLYDENIGGKYGNTHIALGKAYQDCYINNPSKVKKEQWAKMGFNDSPVHTDIMSTTPRTVTAYLKDGREAAIYKNGQFLI